MFLRGLGQEGVVVEHIQDFWLEINHYNGCLVHGFEHCSLNQVLSVTMCMATPWENIHSHAACTHFICSITCKRTWSRSGSNPCTFNLIIHQETQKGGQNDCNQIVKSLKRDNTQIMELLIIMYTANPSGSGKYLSQIHIPILPVCTADQILQ